MPDTSDTLWDWAVRAYAAPGVSEVCLDLQDTAGQSVCLLLWTAWMAQTGRPVDDDMLEAAVDTARAWHGTAVDPLREVRRHLKRPHPDMSGPDREVVRDLVKAAELMAERRLLEALEALSTDTAGTATAPLPPLLAASRAWSTSVPRAGLTTLAERLSA